MADPFDAVELVRLGWALVLPILFTAPFFLPFAALTPETGFTLVFAEAAFPVFFTEAFVFNGFLLAAFDFAPGRAFPALLEVAFFAPLAAAFFPAFAADRCGAGVFLTVFFFCAMSNMRDRIGLRLKVEKRGTLASGDSTVRGRSFSIFAAPWQNRGLKWRGSSAG